MENQSWRFGVVANITEFHTDKDGTVYRGTKPFTAGTKVYLAGKDWDTTREDMSVIGRNRFGKIVLEHIPVDCLENIRTQRIYKPVVLEIIAYLEAIEGWGWWARTSADRKETKKFVENWEIRRK